ncbi:hypothetical protein Vafri_12251 [Volvox africanus]|uniref:Transmembrane protein n=1 Tax=Volvox africanus TaxID=51714 RepID=A0A8J4F288_9CHLO|nr:hypothetical protein Vafri_12251 [Volvox africanus]
MVILRNVVPCIIAGCFSLVGTIVALGGMAKLNDFCNAAANAPYYYSYYYSSQSYYPSALRSLSVKECSDMLSYFWWGITFGVVLSTVALIVALLGKAAHGTWNSTLQAFCAVCVSISMWNANALYPSHYYLGYGSSRDPFQVLIETLRVEGT